MHMHMHMRQIPVGSMSINSHHSSSMHKINFRNLNSISYYYSEGARMAA
jgi:hypothetical protein